MDFYATFGGIFGGGGGGGGGGSVTFTQVAPTGAVDGSNVTYTLPSAPSAPANLFLFLDGIMQYEGIDYTITGTTITMAASPQVGQTLWAVYS